MVKERASPVYTKKKIPPVTQSYHDFMVRRVLQDFAASVIQVSDTSLANEYVLYHSNMCVAVVTLYIIEFVLVYFAWFFFTISLLCMYVHVFYIQILTYNEKLFCVRVTIKFIV